MTRGWAVDRLTGSAADLHARPFDPPVQRRLVVLDVTGVALVLGSTQRETEVDTDALGRRGVELVRRRSGGGAVLLAPGETLWVDVELPRDDPRWDDDVGRAFHWLGHAWADALEELGTTCHVHAGPLRETRLSRAICFAGLGPGEVTVDGRKVVGISQRRTRDGARFQCVVHRRWDPATVLELLRLEGTDRGLALEELTAAAAGLPLDWTDLVEALVGRVKR